MGIHELLQWWNLIYIAPLCISVAWILTTVFSGMHGHGVGHGGHDVGHDVGHAVGHAAHDIAHAAGHAIHHGDSGHVHGDAGHGHTAHAHGHGADDRAGRTPNGHIHAVDHDNTASRLIMLLGIGQVPITLLIGVYLLCWGAFGMLANQIFGSVMHYPAIYIWPSLGVTFVVSFAVTRSMAAIVGRLIPSDETYGVSRMELVGSLGHTVYAVSENAGTVDIKDRIGTVHRVQAKIEPGKEVVPAGIDVIVVDFDEDDKRFIVRQGTI
jgi:membrane protein implicated in regulation of membrane protease activity